MAIGRFFSKKIILFFIVVAAAAGVGIYLSSRNESGVTNTEEYGQKFRVTYYNSKGTNLQEGFSQYLENAVKFWDERILENTVIKLNVRAINLDTNTTLAYGSMNDSSNIRAGGDITINLNARAQNWTDVLKHEIGHVMGIGIADYWRNGVLLSNGVYYLNRMMFPETYQIYRDDYNGEEDDIPLGDVAGHFDESVFTTELMTPFSNEGQRQPITDLTMSTLASLGWNLDMSKSEEKN